MNAKGNDVAVFKPNGCDEYEFLKLKSLLEQMKYVCKLYRQYKKELKKNM